MIIVEIVNFEVEFPAGGAVCLLKIFLFMQD